MRSPEDETNRNQFRSATAASGTIPDVPGAPKGLGGIKAPASYKQTGDIMDRMTAAGYFKPGTYEPKQ